MPPVAQAHRLGPVRPASGVIRAIAFCVLGIPLAGCGAGSASLAQGDVDPTIVSAVPSQSAAAPDVEKLSDAATVRNAVSSADVAQMERDPISWANADTGSRGAINSLVEKKEAGILCRQFTTTRESFDGVAMYQGKACMAGPGTWQILAFTAI